MTMANIFNTYRSTINLSSPKKMPDNLVVVGQNALGGEIDDDCSPQTVISICRANRRKYSPSVFLMQIDHPSPSFQVLHCTISAQLT